MYGYDNVSAYTNYLTPQLQNGFNGASAMGGYQNSYLQQPQPQQPPQPQRPQQFFAQPSGQLFSINNANELQNIPVQENSISAIINPNDNMLYLKSFQNGRPMILDYKLVASGPVQQEKEEAKIQTPIVEEKKEDDLKETIADLVKTIKQMSNRIEELEKTRVQTNSKITTSKKKEVE